jgi:hypothetical protein
MLKAQLKNIQRPFNVGAQIDNRVGEGADDRYLAGDMANRIQPSRE